MLSIRPRTWLAVSGFVVQIGSIAFNTNPTKNAQQNLGRGRGWAVPWYMAKPLVPDELWLLIEPLLPPERPRPKGGQLPVPHRAALSGIIFVLKSGIHGRCCPKRWAVGRG
jgi:hypothetical protein